MPTARPIKRPTGPVPGARRILEDPCTTCCSDVDCDVLCTKPGSSSAGLGICKPDETCVSGGSCLFVPDACLRTHHIGMVAFLSSTLLHASASKKQPLRSSSATPVFCADDFGRRFSEFIGFVRRWS
ncbi:hypothetical protein L1987_08004 [Smallanthus sonchifolius]|uniref:Uncharacterized protein n=1 Tax=Smallanthus sonchifolius TaxID=185202 RepID=A0ACB9JJZ7_9ASTR|nr:hypothetical protein L1987_08004 [Smallanthus sonchifolius]